MVFFEPKNSLEHQPILPNGHSSGSRTWTDTITAVAMGQAASILLCLSGVFSIYLEILGLAAPALQNCISYFFISAVFVPWILIWRPDPSEGFGDIFRARGWKYLVISLSDVAGNYLITLGYQYSSLTSVQVLDSAAIPTVFVISYLFLKARYSYLHFVGMAVSVIGVGFLMWGDMDSGLEVGGTNPVLGDVLTLVGAVTYGFSNSSQEFFAKNFGPYEFLAFVGLFSANLSALLSLFLEDYSTLSWTQDSFSALVAFGMSKFWFYVIVARLIVQSSSLNITLSILSAGIYSVIAGVYAFGYTFSWVFICAFVLIIGGVGLFSVQPIKTLGSQN